MASLHETPHDDDAADPILPAAQPPPDSSATADSSASTSPAAAPAPRPAGGTARSGAKTPRKVQWAPDADAPQDRRRRELEDAYAHAHALDEKGLDPAAFHTLARALERHRSSTSAHAPPSPLVLALPHGPDPPRTDHFPPSFPSSPDLPLSPTDTDTDAPTPTTDGGGLHLGEAYIDPQERAGLPGGHGAADAARLVRAHTARRRGALFRRPRLRRPGGREDDGERRDAERRRGRPREKGLRDDGDDERPAPAPPRGLLASLFARRPSPSPPRPPEPPRAPDVERTAHAPAAYARAPRRAGGVLSALLALYDGGDSASASASTSTSVSLASGASTPVSGAPAPHAHSNPPSPSSARTLAGLPRALAETLEGRPAKARSAAGVFGPLIAGAGSMAAAAAPVNSTVAPSVKRPGFHLTRYSLEAVPTRAQLPRPRSTHFEHSTAGSGSGSAPPDYRRTQSFDVPRGEGAGAGEGEKPRFAPGSFAPFVPGTPGSQATPGSQGAPSHFAHSDASTGTFTPRQKWTDFVRELPKRGWGSRAGTPGPSTPGTPDTDEGGSVWDWDGGRERERERKREKRRKRKKEEIYITRHVAEIIQRQEFILKLARAMMMFGGPTHRLQAQISSTARVLELELSCLYLPDVMLISFDDAATGTSNIKFIRQSSALDLGKLKQGYALYWKVIHDEISVRDAAAALDDLMRRRPLYSSWAIVFFGGMASASICSVSFKGSFIDSLVSFPLGALLVFVQLLSVRNELYSNVFEITIATLLSFLAAALASTHRFCYSAVASSSVVLILPGFIVLCGSLELSSRNIVSGAVRLCYALVYSLFLGFGLAIGAEVYQKATARGIVGPEDYNCVQSHSGAPWYQQTPSLWWAFLTVPMFSLFLSLRNQAPWDRKEIVVCVLVSCIGWVTNHFTGTKFPNQNDISAAVGAFAVGLVANVYGRFFRGNAFVVMITGILFQLPSGLGNGGLLTFAQQQTAGAPNSYLSGFQTALQLISVSIGLTVGLGIALVVTHPILSRKRQGGVFSL